MRSFMFQEKEPAVKFPPAMGIPGSPSYLRAEETGLDGVTPDELPDYMGRTFPAICHFWLLTSEWILVYYNADNTPVSRRVSMEFAERMFKKLLDWSDHLHTMLARGHGSPHHSIILQLGALSRAP